MKYLALKIPFSTKKKGTHSIQGDAYYLLDDDQNVIKQFIQVSTATYRPTDKEMIKPTDYYKKMPEKYLNIRKKFFEKVNPLTISNNKLNRIQLEEEEIVEINKHLLELDRVKRSLDLFTGSNSSGAELKSKAVEIIVNTGDISHWANGINFSNPLNKLKVKQYKKNCEEIKIKDLLEIETVSLDDIVSNPNFKKIIDLLKKYNSWIFEWDSSSWKENFSCEFSKNEEFEKNRQKKFDSKFYETNIEETIKLYNDEIINKERCEKRLRSLQKNLFFISLKELNAYSKINFIDNDEIANEEFDFAHIVSVKSSWEEKVLKKIANPNNCIIMSPTFHRLFDNNKITFDSEGKIIGKINNSKIKPEFLNEERLLFLKENYDFFQKNKRNK